MRVLLAGATGVIGRELVPQLHEAGHSILGLTRSGRGADELREAGVEPVLADLMNRDELLRALDGHSADAVVHQATAIARPPMLHRDLYPTDALRDEGTAHLLDAAALIGAGRFVAQSFFLGYGYHDHGPTPVTEDQPFATLTGHRKTDRHMRSMRACEDQVLQTDGIDGIALRYGMFYGPEPMTQRMADLTRRRLLPAVRPSGLTSPIHLHDAASAAVAALERGRAGHAYNIADNQPVEFTEFLTALAASVGAGPPRTVPAWLLKPLPYLHSLMAVSRIRLNCDKAKRDLGWHPAYPSIHDGLTAMAP
ncbi:NAD-dependent epimerase/dehydratase family protein [Ruania zhangjianzhongii]|uniref:NAD-dependent epimerase/dehydratase family protein n=1 Tax=Ruania zhangjianzhongii TaxID=2603206 RepID=UPI0011C9D2F6|nr:NAD(P)-dependent oxidoreductase [Ruania zhangjianzhongii]